MQDGTYTTTRPETCSAPVSALQPARAGRLGLLLWPLRPKPRNVLAWLIALGLAASYLVHGWKLQGHVSCDFGGPWLLGRMLLRGEGHELYLRQAGRQALASGYRGADLKTVDQEILGKSHREVEGPLYPPTAALLMAPFAILDPQACHAVLSLLFAQLLFVSAWLIRQLTSPLRSAEGGLGNEVGRLRTGEIALLILLFPNSCQTLLLGQNAALTLTIITAGLLLRQWGWPLLGGLVWGLLAYKPVFALALLGVPLLLPSRRMFVGMVAGGTAFSLATLPFCGLDAWFRWLEVGRHAARLYADDPNWIWLSRDLLGIPRRDLWDQEHFVAHLGYAFYLREWNEEFLQTVVNTPARTAAGWALVLAVALVTIGIGLCGIRSTTAAAEPARTAFLVLGGLLTCYHFMYYDVLGFALPVLLLLAESGRMTRIGRIGIVLVVAGLVACQIDMELGRSPIRIPFETFLLLAAWLGAGLRAWRRTLA